MSFFGVYSDDDYHAVIGSVYNSFDVQEKLRADFALLLLTDEAILINQKKCERSRKKQTGNLMVRRNLSRMKEFISRQRFCGKEDNRALTKRKKCDKNQHKDKI